MAALPPAKSKSSAVGPALLPVERHRGKPPIKLTRPVYVVGSRSSARIHLVSSSVSKAHALVVRSNGRTYIRDLASRSKVIINGQPQREATLSDGDLIQIGSFSFKYLAGAGEDRFRQRADREAPGAKLDITGAEFPIPIDQRVLLIGRRSLCDIKLLEESVSTAHAVIFEMDGQRFIRDLGSRTGTFVNNVSTHQHQLAEGDIVRIGETEIVYQLGEVTTETPEDRVAVPALDVDEIDADVTAAEPEIEDDLLGLAAEETAETSSAEAPVGQAPDEAEETEPFHGDIAPAVSDEETEEAVAPDSVPEAQTPAADAPLTVEALGEAPEALEVAEPAAEAAVEPQADAVSGAALTVTDLLKDESFAAPADAPAAPVEDEVAIPLATDVESEAMDDAAAGLSAAAEAPESARLDLAPADTIESDAGVEAALEPAESPELDVLPAEPLAEPESLAAEAPEPEALPIETIESADLPEIDELAETEATAGPTLELEQDVDPVVDELAVEEDIAAPKLTAEAPEDAETIAPAQAAAVEPVQLPQDAIADDITPAELPQEDEIPPVVSEADVTEVLEQTEPTVESALDAAADELALDAVSAPSAELPEVPADELTDTKFDKAVAEFSGGEIGDIVETDEAAPEAQPLPLDESAAKAEAETLAASLAGDQAADEAAPLAVSEADVPIDELPEPPQDEKPPELELPKVAEAPRRTPPRPSRPQTPAYGISAPPGHVPWGANQDNFLGGVPLSLGGPPAPPKRQPPRAPKPPLSNTPIRDEAVKDLIDEIDTAAAAAEAASSKSSPAPLIPSLPPRPRLTTPSRALLRAKEPQIPPTATDEPTRGTITTGFDGLAMPPVRETDVFSQGAPSGSPAAMGLAGIPIDEQPRNRPLTPMDQVQPEPGVPTARRGGIDSFGAVATDDAMEIPEAFGDIDEDGDDADSLHAARARRSLPTRPTTVEGTLVGPSTQHAYAAELSETEINAIRRKYRRRVWAIVLLMFALIGGAYWYIYSKGVNSSIEASFSYKNLASLNRNEQLKFQKEQLELLRQNTVRQYAADHVRGDTLPGFLKDPPYYFRVIDSARFSEEKPDVLTLRMNSTDAARDTQRVIAILSALYNGNQDLLDNAVRQRRNLDDLNKQIESTGRELASINKRLDDFQQAQDRNPGGDNLKQLQDQFAALEDSLKAAISAKKAAESELEQLKSVPAGTADAAVATAAPVEDEKLKAMQAELADLMSKVNAQKAVSSEQSATARRALDMALDDFQKQVADAQGKMNGSPELAAYVQDAQKLQDTTRQITDQLVHRQEQQFTRLTELKARLSEQMEQRRVELWKGDKQIQELTEQLALLSRQLNAAVGSGLPQAEDLKARVELTKSLIKARQDLLPGDAFWVDTINQLQTIIDATRKDIDEDRAKTEQLLTQLQQTFTTGKSVQKLPQEQKQLAEKLQQQLAAINAARQKYNQAADANVADADAQLKNQIATIQTAIDTRKKQLADENLKDLESRQAQNRLTEIEKKEQALAQLTAAESAANSAWYAKHKEIADAEEAISKAKRDSAERSELVAQKEAAERTLKELSGQVELKKKQAASAIEPVAPSAADVAVAMGEDHRPLYTLGSAAGIFVICLAMILFTLHTSSVRAPAISLHAADLKPMDHAGESEDDSSGNGSNGNGHKSSGNGESHEPAVV
jgi:pSer/pThr/pTyr-binding forkhead associated (FHA) protein